MNNIAPLHRLKFPLVAILALTLVTVGCGLAKSVADGAHTYACIQNDIDSNPPGAVTYEKIAVDCGGLAIQDVEDIVNAILEAAKKPDAGTMAAQEPTDFHKKALAVHHK